MKKRWLLVKKNSEINKFKAKREMALVDYYENMRSYAINDGKVNGLPMGLDLYLKKGMKCWIDAWHSNAMHQAAIRDNIGQASCAIPDVVIPDIVILITELLLGSKEEIRGYG